MANPFSECQKVEAYGMSVICDWLRLCRSATLIVNQSREHFLDHQAYGDLIVQVAGTHGRPMAVYTELKIEQDNRHNNLFIETWSNKSRYTIGWIYKSMAERLLYYFAATDELHSVNMGALKDFIFSTNSSNLVNGFSYPERRQNKYQQLNDTWGLCVPIKCIAALQTYKLSHPARELALWKNQPRMQMVKAA